MKALPEARGSQQMLYTIGNSSSNSNELPFRLFTLFLLFFRIFFSVIIVGSLTVAFYVAERM
jgi:hypothetical protein